MARNRILFCRVGRAVVLHNWDGATGLWQSTAGRWHVSFTDLSGRQGLLGQVEGRAAAAVIDWLAEPGQAWRDAVSRGARMVGSGHLRPRSYE